MSSPDVLLLTHRCTPTNPYLSSLTYDSVREELKIGMPVEILDICIAWIKNEHVEMVLGGFLTRVENKEMALVVG